MAMSLLLHYLVLSRALTCQLRYAILMSLSVTNVINLGIQNTVLDFSMQVHAKLHKQCTIFSALPSSL
jgi:hypothetical protein